jgi:AraC-like DNA-binding protein
MFWTHDFPAARAALYPCAHGLSRSRSAAGLREPLRLYNLRVPFVIRVTARRGEHRLASGRRSGILHEGASLVLPAYRKLDYEGATIIDARSGHELHLHIDGEPHDAAPRATGDAARSLRRRDAEPVLAIRLARAVFLNPAADWSFCRAAEHTGMTPGSLRTQLFRESNALTTIVREQRLMRALFALLARPHTQAELKHLGGQWGFTSGTRFRSAFSRHFGCSTAQLAKLAWCPPLTWSAAPALCVSGGLGEPGSEI